MGRLTDAKAVKLYWVFRHRIIGLTLDVLTTWSLLKGIWVMVRCLWKPVVSWPMGVGGTWWACILWSTIDNVAKRCRANPFVKYPSHNDLRFFYTSMSMAVNYNQTCTMMISNVTIFQIAFTWALSLTFLNEILIREVAQRNDMLLCWILELH